MHTLNVKPAGHCRPEKRLSLTIRKTLRKQALVIVSLLGLAWGNAAFAAGTSSCRVTSAESVNFPNAKLFAGSPVGTVLASTTASISTTCTASGAPSGRMGFYLKAANVSGGKHNPVRLPDGSYAWTTGIQGIGLRITGGANNIMVSILSNGQDLDYRTTEGFSDTAHSWTDTFRYELVTTSTSVAGGSLSGELWQIYWHDIADNRGAQMEGVSSVNGIISIQGVSPTCSVDAGSRNKTVNLGSIKAADLEATGASPSVPLQLSFNCSGGETGAPPVFAYITFTDATNPYNRSSTLMPTSSSTASGVAIELRDLLGWAIYYGPDSPAPGIPGQVNAGIFANGSYTVEYLARMVKFGTVTPGLVNAIATFTMSYQ